MIGVLAAAVEGLIISEFFELFKTPWEYYRAEGSYEVLLCYKVPPPETRAKLLVVYGLESLTSDGPLGIVPGPRLPPGALSYENGKLPIYGDCVAFAEGGDARSLKVPDTARPVVVKRVVSGQKVVRVGYDLFGEVAWLLTQGQPGEHAERPTLEIHIALLRQWMIESGVSFVEIPPVPEGANFMVCLTHDVDHVGVRNHKFDHTFFGFLYRATIGSLVQFTQGRKSLKQVATNWLAALSLPFVHLGLAKDFWYQFDAYLSLENGLPSTFFLIPRKGDPGRNPSGGVSPKRAASYDVSELADHLKQLLAAGCEVGVHGLDAWRDTAMGRREFECVSVLTGLQQLGVRMHWLYFQQEKSPAILEEAGFLYDSTVGYNNTVGFRAGTSQAYRPLGAKRLLELPLQVMDTALFYPTYLNLSSEEAKRVVSPLIDSVAQFGGSFTVNWHDRSLAPERLWGDFYQDLVEELKRRGAWFSTASQATRWYAKRRSARIEKIQSSGETIQVQVTMPESGDGLPGLRLRFHNASIPNKPRTGLQAVAYVDVPLNESGEFSLPA